MSTPRGIVAAGHVLTAETAGAVLADGGNAFDAVLAGLCTACVAEPALASLGGGGFLMARPAEGGTRLYDFFTHTPIAKRPTEELDFRAILVDFGAATQEFHVGFGSVAVPGVVRGLFEAHAELGTMPFTELVAPAVKHAREGVVMNDFQAYTVELLNPIFSSNPTIEALYRSPSQPDRLIARGETMRQPELADTLEALAREGADLFYRGDIAAAIASDMHDGGGHLSLDDLSAYQVARREPLRFALRDAQVLTNPPPSSGGLLIGFATGLLESTEVPAFGSHSHLQCLASAMELTDEARLDAGLDHSVTAAAARKLLSEQYTQTWREQIAWRARCTRGTTHLSVIDAAGNAAALSVSNGEGSAYVVPGTGVCLNNMLGEEDLNPGGFHRWPAGQRMTSMMAPSVVTWPDGAEAALGSGGSNRIRTALLQVLSNLVEHHMPVEKAVCAPRLHMESGVLSVEHGFDADCLEPVLERYPEHQLFPEANMFFGGAHTVVRVGNTLSGAGDPRRGGACVSM